MRIFWTNTAYKSLQEITDYLSEEWNNETIIQLFDEIEKPIERIKQMPEIGILSEDPRYRKILINKHVSLFYEFEYSKITVMLFWSNYQDPSKLDHIL